jgi:predicted dehydrogenase
MRVAIAGCGFIGRKRAEVCSRPDAGVELVLCCDVDLERAHALACQYPGAEAVSDWRVISSRGNIDAVVVATPHHLLAPITLDAVRAGKHVLVEKPGATRSEDFQAIIEASARTGALVRVGFNHRCHRAFRKAKQILESGQAGPLLFIRARYGHGGRPGYDREWRARPEISGGGELIDQGIHLIDLSRWLLGDFSRVQGRLGTWFWNMPVEDNAFLLLETAAGQVAFLHASWTEWKNLFSFEIVGRDGKLEIFGLGGSYGTERLTFYHMLPGMGPPETTAWEYAMADDSWEVEFAAFLEDIRCGRQPDPGPEAACAALRVAETLYAQAKVR